MSSSSMLPLFRARSASPGPDSTLKWIAVRFVQIGLPAIVLFMILTAFDSTPVVAKVPLEPIAKWLPKSTQNSIFSSDYTSKFQQPIELRRVSFTVDDSESFEERYDARFQVQEERFTCRDKTIYLVGWWDDEPYLDPLRSFYNELRRIAAPCQVKMIGTAGKWRVNMDISATIKDADVVIWWNWKQNVTSLQQARKDHPKQTWVVLNRDDPHSLFVVDVMHQRKKLYDIAFSSGTAALPTYTIAGAKEAHAFVPAVDESHFYDPDPSFECDVAFIGTQPYSERGSPRNRTHILEVLTKDAQETGWKLSVYGTEALGAAFPEFYKGPVDYQENRKVWSNAKISLNFHVVDGFGGWYANARTTEILGSKGLLLVDRAVEGVVHDMQEAVFLNSNDPHDLVKQIHEILDNYSQYEPIRERGYKLAHTIYSSQALATRMLKAISRVRKVTHKEIWQ